MHKRSKVKKVNFLRTFSAIGKTKGRSKTFHRKLLIIKCPLMSKKTGFPIPLVLNNLNLFWIKMTSCIPAEEEHRQYRHEGWKTLELGETEPICGARRFPSLQNQIKFSLETQNLHRPPKNSIARKVLEWHYPNSIEQATLLITWQSEGKTYTYT